MKLPFCRRALALVLGAVVCLATSASARIVVPERVDDETVTVVLADGWEITDVYVEWSDTDGALVVERPDGARRLIVPEDLAGVRDAWGRDISRWYLPDWALARLGDSRYVPDDRPVRRPPPPVQPVPRPEPVRPWHEIGGQSDRLPRPLYLEPRVILGLEMGFSAPREGDFGSVDGGFGVEALLRMQLGGPLYVSGGYLYQNLNQQHYDYPVVCPEDVVDCWTPYYDPVDRVHGAWVGLSLVSRTSNPQTARFYLDAGVGRFAVDGYGGWSWQDDYVGYRLGAGLLFPLGSNAAIDLGVRALNIRDLGAYWDDEGDTLLGGRVGVSVLAF